MGVIMKILFIPLIILLSIVACSPGTSSSDVTVNQSQEAGPTDQKSTLQTPQSVSTALNLPLDQAFKTPTILNTTSTPTTIFVQEENDNTLGTVLLMFGDRYDYRQYEGVHYYLEKANYRIVIASSTLEPIEAIYVTHGFEFGGSGSRNLPTVTANLLLEQVQIGDYDAYILISDEDLVFKGSTDVKHIVREAITQGKVVAANDMAVLILGTAGILEGVEITSNPLICMQMEKENRAICRQKTVHRDGQIITAGPDHATSSFVKEIIAAIQDNY
jgi:putative intracellular protease/amidase